MNEQEAIYELKYQEKQRAKGNDYQVNNLVIGKAIEALEKQIAKKVEIWNGEASCPCCNKLFGPMEIIKNLISWDMDYCKYCGQKLDWSEDE